MSVEQGDNQPSRAESWASRIAAGDGDAETEFIRHYQTAVRALVRRRTRSLEPDVDDMTQDVLRSTLMALRKGNLRDPSTLPAYLRGAVVLIARAHYRKQHRRGEDHLVALDDTLESDDDPARNLGRSQLAAVMRRLIDELGVERDRELLQRFYLQEQAKETVCAELGIGVDHFHRVAFRARERLRLLLQQAGISHSG